MLINQRIESLGLVYTINQKRDCISCCVFLCVPKSRRVLEYYVARTTDSAECKKKAIGTDFWEKVVRAAKQGMTLVESVLKFQKFLGHEQCS